MPHPQKLNKKKILLIDFVFTGVSVIAVKSYFEKYYKQINQPQQIEIFGISVSNSKINTALAEQMYTVELPENSSLAYRFEKHLFDDYSKVSEFDLEKTSYYQMKSQNDYEKFKESVNIQLNLYQLKANNFK